MERQVAKDGQPAEDAGYMFKLKRPLGKVFESSGKSAVGMAAALAAKLTRPVPAAKHACNRLAGSISTFNRLIDFFFASGINGMVKGTAFSIADILAQDEEPVTMLMLTENDLIRDAARLISHMEIPVGIAIVSVDGKEQCTSVEEFLHGADSPLLSINMMDVKAVETDCLVHEPSWLRAFFSEELFCGGHDHESVLAMAKLSRRMQEFAGKHDLWAGDVPLVIARRVACEMYVNNSGSVIKPGTGGETDILRLTLAMMRRQRIKEGQRFRIAGRVRTVLAQYGC